MDRHASRHNISSTTLRRHEITRCGRKWKADSSLRTCRVKPAGQVSGARQNRAAHEGVGRALETFPSLPRGAHPEIKFWYSRLGLNMRLAISFWKHAHAEKPKKDAGIKTENSGFGQNRVGIYNERCQGQTQRAVVLLKKKKHK